MNEEVSECILVWNLIGKNRWCNFNHWGTLLLLEQRILELLSLRLLHLALFNNLFLNFFFFNLLIISCILLALLNLLSFINDLHSTCILLCQLSFSFLPDSNAIWSLGSSSRLLIYFHVLIFLNFLLLNLKFQLIYFKNLICFNWSLFKICSNFEFSCLNFKFVKGNCKSYGRYNCIFKKGNGTLHKRTARGDF